MAHLLTTQELRDNDLVIDKGMDGFGKPQYIVKKWGTQDDGTPVLRIVDVSRTELGAHDLCCRHYTKEAVEAKIDALIEIDNNRPLSPSEPGYYDQF